VKNFWKTEGKTNPKISFQSFRWLKPIINKEMKLVDVAKVCPHYSVQGLTLHTNYYVRLGDEEFELQYPIDVHLIEVE